MKSSIYLWALLVFSDYFVVYIETYSHDDGNGKNTALIVGVTICGVVLVLLLAGLCAFCQRKIAITATKSSIPLASFKHPQPNRARWFSFKDIKHCTNNFSHKNEIGAGGYGKVYKGKLRNGQLVAVKRAKPESVQGEREFKTEIELLSRVNHQNVVNLVGFCHDKGEQMLIYEYVANGSLMTALSGKSGFLLCWKARLKVALGVARGLEYLHDHVDPPIIHRDIKPDNILLDDNLNAKVADFGLSKLLSNGESHVITHAKGTFGYMDPEYCNTQWLTQKCDVYSFGVVMLELVTGSRLFGKNWGILRVKETKDIHSLTDPAIRSDTLTGLKEFVDLAKTCLHALGDERPSMIELLMGIQNIIKAGNVVINVGSTSTSAFYDEAVDVGSTSTPAIHSEAVDIGSTSTPAIYGEAVDDGSTSTPAIYSEAVAFCDENNTSVACEDKDYTFTKPCYDEDATDEPFGYNFCNKVINRESGWER